MKKRIWAMLLAAVLAVTCFGAAVAEEKEEPLEIRMTVRLFDQIPDMENDYWTRFQEMTNTKLNVEWIPDGDYATKLNLILASGQLPEVIISQNARIMENSALANAVKNGAFWDLTEFLGDFSEYPNLRDYVAPDSWKICTVFGKIMGVPQSRASIQGAPLYREDLFTEAGVAVPTNMDELITSIKAVMEKNPNMVGLVAKGNLIQGASGGLESAFGTNDPCFNEEGGLVFTYLTPAYTKYIEWARKAYEAGIISQEFAVMAPTQATELFQSGNAICLVGESIRWAFPFTDLIKAVKDDASVTVLPPLVGIDDNYSISRGSGIIDVMLISSNVPAEKVKKILKYFDTTITPEYYDITSNGFEGIHYTRNEDGTITKTEQRDKDMGSSAPWQVVPLMYNPYMKVDSTAAPAEYNQALRDKVTEMGYFDLGKFSPFDVAISSTWVSVWPRYVNEWSAMAVKAVVGQISMEEYQAYVDTLNNNEQIRKAYLEFAESYKATYGD